MGAFKEDVETFRSWVDTNVGYIWGDDRSGGSELSELWVGNFQGAGAIMQSSATDALLARAALAL